MKRLLAVAFWLVAALPGAGAQPARAEDFGEAYQKSVGAVVYITAIDTDWGILHGTGVVDDAKLGHILTAYHVVGADSLVTAHLPAFDKAGALLANATEYANIDAASRCVVIARDPKRDLALLKWKAAVTGLKSIPLAQESSRPGQAVFTIGNDAAASMWHFAAGNTRQVHDDDYQFRSGQRITARVLEVTTPINPGDSGGPLLNIAGELVGITSSVIPGANQVQKGIDVSEIRGFLMKAAPAAATAKAAR
jgi:S1-C subfamily serine protease